MSRKTRPGPRRARHRRRAHSNQVRLQIRGPIHDPTDPVGRLLFNVLAMVAEFEADLIRTRTREGDEDRQAKGRYEVRSPSSHPPRKRISSPCTAPESTRVASSPRFNVARSTVYRALERADRQVVARGKPL